MSKHPGSKQPGLTTELLKLCGQMRDQTITPPQAQRLNTLLIDHKSARHFYLRFMSLTAGLETHQAEAIAEVNDTASDSDVDLLLDLLQMEQDAQAELVHADKPSRAKRRLAKQLSTSSHDQPISKLLNSSFMLYLAGQAVRSKPAQWLAAAAVVALGILLAIQFIGPAATPSDPIAENTSPDKPAESAPPILRDHPGTQPVATLTATHNAVWSDESAEGASAPGSRLTPGSKLHPNQRLTLTAGFAEITTHDGAIAIVEAPATVELINSNNAIRLHTGKLVGKVSSDSKRANGFTVVTPAARIVDIGTAFGVTHDAQGTRTRVIEGEIDISPAAADELVQPTRLVVGECAVVATGSGELTTLDRLTDRYVSDWSALINPPRVEGQGRFDPSMPTDLLPGAFENDQIVVFQEHAALRLPRELPVSMQRTLPNDLADAHADELADGTVVDCYLVHLDLLGVAPVTRRKVTLHFDRPILGVVGSADEILASSRVLDRPGIQYREKAEGLLSDWVHAIELPGNPRAGLVPDKITISEDRKRMDIELVSGPLLDQFRILVESQEN